MINYILLYFKKHYVIIFRIPEQPYSYEIIKEIADFLLERVKEKPKIGIICGTGLGELSQRYQTW